MTPLLVGKESKVGIGFIGLLEHITQVFYFGNAEIVVGNSSSCKVRW
jgi:hypothetical protein